MNEPAPQPKPFLNYDRPDSLSPSASFSQYFIVIISLPFVGAICVWSAALATQRFTGHTVLFYPATGTHAFDFWLIDIPFYLVTLFYVAVCLHAIILVLLRRLAATALALLLPVCLFAWLLFLVGCFPIWEEISP